jgi:hypothetical protein
LNAHKINEGDLIQVKETGEIFYVNGGKRQPISNFVKSQRFSQAGTKGVSQSDVTQLPEGSFAEPLDGTLIKSANNPTVYFMYKGLRLPITYQVFTMKGFSFASVVTLSETEINSWLPGSFLAPPDGSLLKTPSGPTVYWVVGGVLHPVNYGYYITRGLNVFPVSIISQNDLKSFSKGEAFIADSPPLSAAQKRSKKNN